MSYKNKWTPHNFHVPVMGTGFTIDSPIKIAKFGISSTMSLMDDYMMKDMYTFYSEQTGRDVAEIAEAEDHGRSEIITRYLNLSNDIVNTQIEEIRQMSFGDDSDLDKYFQLLPQGPGKTQWQNMLAETDSAKKTAMQQELRKLVVPGKLDVNIMTKVDPDIFRKGELIPYEFTVAQSALRGFANSDLDSSIVFSAGLNPRLYNYIPEFVDFFPTENGYLKKRIALKVSDFRSAMIQGKYLAKKGIWVSEFRVESSINCGGHAFLQGGHLMGPVLQEFAQRRQELSETLFKLYSKALAKRDLSLDNPPNTLLTAQGGVGTSEEAEFLQSQFGVDSVGWGTPFLLVPEAVAIDDEHLQKLSAAEEKDIILNQASPLGVPFWYLNSAAAEEARVANNKAGKPGSSCPIGYLAFSTEYTEKPICAASKGFQKLAGEDIDNRDIPDDLKISLKENLRAKACLCRDLAASALLSIGAPRKNAAPVICPGPNLSNFTGTTTLKQMIDHIYGRINILNNPNRPHMFLKEMSLYIDRFGDKIHACPKSLMEELSKEIHDLEVRIIEGIDYYHEMAADLAESTKADFVTALETIRDEMETLKQQMSSAYSPATA
jgi:hypothetical protein